LREIKLRIERHAGTDYMYDLFIPACDATNQEDVNEILTGDGVKRVVNAVIERAFDTL
jgi:hypothetical protein